MCVGMPSSLSGDSSTGQVAHWGLPHATALDAASPPPIAQARPPRQSPESVVAAAAALAGVPVLLGLLFAGSPSAEVLLAGTHGIELCVLAPKRQVGVGMVWGCGVGGDCFYGVAAAALVPCPVLCCLEPRSPSGPPGGYG